jgi:hypothetical protein
VSLTKHLEQSRAVRVQHTDLSTPCVLTGQWKAKVKLLEHLGLTDDVPPVFRSRVHLCHLCENGTNTDSPCSNPLHTYWGSNLENCGDRYKSPVRRHSFPPAYDGSRGALPTDHVGVLDLVGRYGRSRPTLFKRRDLLVKHRLISPEKVANRVWYSPQDVLEFDKLDYWMQLGFAQEELDTYLRGVTSKPVEQVGETAASQLLVELVREFTAKAEQLLSVQAGNHSIEK